MLQDYSLGDLRKAAAALNLLPEVLRLLEAVHGLYTRLAVYDDDLLDQTYFAVPEMITRIRAVLGEVPE